MAKSKPNSPSASAPKPVTKDQADKKLADAMRTYMNGPQKPEMTPQELANAKKFGGFS